MIEYGITSLQFSWTDNPEDMTLEKNDKQTLNLSNPDKGRDIISQLYRAYREDRFVSYSYSYYSFAIFKRDKNKKTFIVVTSDYPMIVKSNSEERLHHLTTRLPPSVINQIREHLEFKIFPYDTSKNLMTSDYTSRPLPSFTS